MQIAICRHHKILSKGKSFITLGISLLGFFHRNHAFVYNVSMFSLLGLQTFDTDNIWIDHWEEKNNEVSNDLINKYGGTEKIESAQNKE